MTEQVQHTAQRARAAGDQHKGSMDRLAAAKESIEWWRKKSDGQGARIAEAEVRHTHIIENHI